MDFSKEVEEHVRNIQYFADQLTKQPVAKSHDIDRDGFLDPVTSLLENTQKMSSVSRLDYYSFNDISAELDYKELIELANETKNNLQLIDLQVSLEPQALFSVTSEIDNLIKLLTDKLDTDSYN